MAMNRVLPSILLAASALFLGACATQPEGSLLDKKFERAANNYQQFQHDGQVVYCQRAGTRSMPMSCLTETQLRAQVEFEHRHRSTSSGAPIPPGAGQTGIIGTGI
jgi:hypothetical protein